MSRSTKCKMEEGKVISFDLTKEQERIQSEVADFGKTVIAPRAEQIDRDR